MTTPLQEFDEWLKKQVEEGRSYEDILSDGVKKIAELRDRRKLD